MTRLLIGGVAERTGLSAATIRYYESIGLITTPVRSEKGYRRYTEAVVEELRFVRKAQALGFSLDEIGEILRLSRAGQAPCSHVLDLARRRVAAVEERIGQLSRLRDSLSIEIAKWDGHEQPTCQQLCEIILNVSDAPVRPEGTPLGSLRRQRESRASR